MSGLLDGGLAAVFGSAFGSFFLDGTLHRVGATKGRDSRGRVISVDAAAAERIKGQVESVTEAMRAADGYTARDARLIVLQVGPDGTVARPTSDDEITLGGTRWSVDMIASDPAATYWEARGTPIAGG